EEPYKLELLEDLKGKITFYQNGTFLDLCRGPHVKNTSELKAFKLMRIAGAYWKGNSERPMLQRIYGIAFKTEQELKDHLALLEEAEKRNHVRLGKELGLFSIHEEGPGFPFFHPKGMIVWQELMKYWKEEHNREGYHEIKTPIILNKNLWEQSGHWDHYKNNMYFTKIDEKDFAVKPMNCPGGILVYRSTLHSYRELPLRLAEVGLVHRHELSGVLNGLFRVRCFHQDDAHIYCMESQIKDEIINIMNLIDRVYKTFRLEYHVELSTRPTNSIGTDEMWEAAESALKEALKETSTEYKLNEGDGAFYGPKIDFHIRDALGRTWQCATIQVDFAMPERFELTYEGSDGRKHRPVMLHRVVYGAMERFLGILIEHYAGKFPTWLSPVQVVLMTVTDRNNELAQEVFKKMKDAGIRVELDDRSESIGKKVRDNQVRKINYMITLGDKEQEHKTLAIRTRDGKVRFGVHIHEFLEEITKEIRERS
ncbi:threonine--tRNA ligase, partial [Candidatus Woesearchaeota archaeon]|nr:threonine--tRNA ligase [Candidatus Woesearchaeota archaeon]